VGSRPSQNRPLYIAVLHIGERDRAVILDGLPDRNSCGLHALAGPTTHFAALVFYASALDFLPAVLNLVPYLHCIHHDRNVTVTRVRDKKCQKVDKNPVSFRHVHFPTVVSIKMQSNFA
jgi:hypothetical protein